MVFTARPDGSLEFLNKRWSEFTGYDPAIALNEAWQSFIHPEDFGRIAAAWQQAISRGGDFSAEFRVRNPGGGYAWILASASPLRDSRNGIVRWYGSAVHIDAAKLITQTLQEREAMLADSERRFRVLAEAIPVICWTADASGWIDWYNHRWYEFTGQTPEEAEGWGWQSAHHPDDFLEVMRQWPHSIATGEPFEMEFRLRRHDGMFHWFLTRAEPLRDDGGAIVRWYGSNVDIQAQKQALERTKRIAETLQDIFLPKHLPQRANLRLDAVYLPAEKDALVGGDWFDAFELPAGDLVFSIGDVAGHGLSASVIVGRLRQAIYTLAVRERDPAKILEETDRILQQQEPDTLVTALVGFIDPSHAQLRYASAGHPPPLIAYSNEELAATLPFGEPPLGTGFGPRFTTHSASIQPDAVVAVYTDGMVEFSEDILGNERKLRAALTLLVGNTTIARPALAVQEIVFDEMPARDDAALLLLQFSVVSSAGLRSDPSALERMWRFHSSDAYTAHKSRQEIVAYLKRMAANHDEIFNSELVLGEILANTVEHAPGLVELSIDWTGEKPVLTVRDTGPGLRSLNGRLPENILDEDGRGIFLIKALAEEASVKPSQGFGTELRIVLPLSRRGYARKRRDAP